MVLVRVTGTLPARGNITEKDNRLEEKSGFRSGGKLVFLIGLKLRNEQEYLTKRWIVREDVK